jgi:hypothetical protein
MQSHLEHSGYLPSRRRPWIGSHWTRWFKAYYDKKTLLCHIEHRVISLSFIFLSFILHPGSWSQWYLKKKNPTKAQLSNMFHMFNILHKIIPHSFLQSCVWIVTSIFSYVFMIYFGVHVNLPYNSKRNLLRFPFLGVSSSALQTNRLPTIQGPQSHCQTSSFTGWHINSHKLFVPVDFNSWICKMWMLMTIGFQKAYVTDHMYTALWSVPGP